MWKKVSKEVLDKAPEIIPLKKGELQIKYAETLVRIDKAIDYMEESMNNPLKYEWGVLKHTLEILKGEE